jgi:hypothetical protein
MLLASLSPPRPLLVIFYMLPVDRTPALPTACEMRGEGKLPLMIENPETRFVAVGDADVAYQVSGDGPLPSTLRERPSSNFPVVIAPRPQRCMGSLMRSASS